MRADPDPNRANPITASPSTPRPVRASAPRPPLSAAGGRGSDPGLDGLKSGDGGALVVGASVVVVVPGTVVVVEVVGSGTVVVGLTGPGVFPSDV